MSIATLIAKLKELEADDSIKNDRHIYLTDGEHGDLHPLVREIVSLADSELVTSDGNCNWFMHDVLKNNGFPVVKGEGDSFGWLTGVIKTSKGQIVYG